MFYNNKCIFVTGGAGFIGSTLTSQLIKNGATTTIGDNLSTGSLKNILRIWKENNLKYKKTNWGYQAENNHKFIFTDFREFSETLKALSSSEIIFHLAANFGGRGYIDTHPADCSENFSINENVIRAASKIGVERIQYASTACVYPYDLQKKYNSKYLLKESDAIKNNWANADQEYGWAKLMGELTLKAYHKQHNLKGSITRYVTAYGPWENDTHAIIALIRRAVNRKDPYVVWGSGKQDRDFTYVDDIVSGTLAICEKITNTNTFNLGTSVRHTMTEVVDLIFDILDWKPKEIIYDRSKPEGVKTRALDIQKTKKIIGWKPQFTLKQGLEKTIKWFLKENPKSVETII